LLVLCSAVLLLLLLMLLMLLLTLLLLLTLRACVRALRAIPVRRICIHSPSAVLMYSPRSTSAAVTTCRGSQSLRALLGAMPFD
jgi:hypothetical protein